MRLDEGSINDKDHANTSNMAARDSAPDINMVGKASNNKRVNHVASRDVHDDMLPTNTPVALFREASSP